MDSDEERAKKIRTRNAALQKAKAMFLETVEVEEITIYWVRSGQYGNGDQFLYMTDSYGASTFLDPSAEPVDEIVLVSDSIDHIVAAAVRAPGNCDKSYIIWSQRCKRMWQLNQPEEFQAVYQRDKKNA